MQNKNKINKPIPKKNTNSLNKINSSKKTSNNQRNIMNNKNNNKLNYNTKTKNNKNTNNIGFDIYDPKNAVEFNRQFLGLNGNGMGEDGMFVGEGIFNMNLPMHKPGEIPDFSNPYGNNFFGNNKGSGGPLNPRTQPLEYLQKFFGGFGIEFPVKEIMNSPPTKHNINNNNYRKNKNASAPKKLIKNSNNNNINIKSKNIVNKNQSKNNNSNNNKKVNVHRHEFDRNIFNSNNITNDEELFADNYCSNFRSNLEKEVFDYLLSLIKGNRVLPSEQKQTPIKGDILKKLNRFDMNEKYMKNNNNSLEAPFCCICLADIILKQQCVLLPCGHLLHSKCIELWLKKNSICPMCRFDLNDYFSYK